MNSVRFGNCGLTVIECYCDTIVTTSLISINVMYENGVLCCLTQESIDELFQVALTSFNSPMWSPNFSPYTGDDTDTIRISV